MPRSRTRRSSKSPPPSPKSLSPSQPRSLPPKLPRLKHKPKLSQNPKLRRPGKRLLSFDRRLGARFVAGADEAGRGSLAGPLVVAGVLLDYAELRDHRVRPLAELNDSKQVSPADREELFHAVVGCARAISVRVLP